MQDIPKMCLEFFGSVSFNLHFSHLQTKTEVCFNLLFPRIRTNEWPKRKAVVVAWSHKMITFSSSNSKLKTCTKTENKNIVYSSRKATPVCKAFICAIVLTSLDPLKLCWILFRCFHREKTSRRHVARHIVKGMNVNIELAKTRCL